MIFGLIIWMIIIMIVVWLLVSNIRIVPQAHAYVIERLGTYQTTWEEVCIRSRKSDCGNRESDSNNTP